MAFPIVERLLVKLFRKYIIYCQNENDYITIDRVSPILALPVSVQIIMVQKTSGKLLCRRTQQSVDSFRL